MSWMKQPSSPPNFFLLVPFSNLSPPDLGWTKERPMRVRCHGFDIRIVGVKSGRGRLSA